MNAADLVKLTMQRLAKEREEKSGAEQVEQVKQPEPEPVPEVKIDPIVEEAMILAMEAHPAPEAGQLSLCTCKHPFEIHEEDGRCSILECDCEQFVAANPEQAIEDALKAAAAELAASGGKPFTIPAAVAKAELSEGEPDIEINPNGDQPTPLEEAMQCEHICKCGQRWSHGAWHKCATPDLKEISPCPACLTAGYILTGKPTNQEIEVRNDEMKVCADMNLDQLELHITFLLQKIEELRIRHMAARKVRADKEEEAHADWTPEQKREFEQAVRRGQKAKAPKATAASTDKVRMSKEEKAIQSMMKAGMSREQAMKLMNG